MKKVAALFVVFAMLFAPMKADAAHQDICTPDIVVNGVITVPGTCVKTDPLPEPLPPIPTVKPDPIVVPPLPTLPPLPPLPTLPPILPTPGSPTPSNPPNTQGPGTSTPDKPKADKPTAKERAQARAAARERAAELEKKRKAKILAERKAEEKQAAKERRQRVINVAFIIVATLAFLGLMYIMFYRHKADRKSTLDNDDDDL